MSLCMQKELLYEWKKLNTSRLKELKQKKHLKLAFTQRQSTQCSPFLLIDGLIA